MGSVAALETAQIQLFLKKPEPRTAFSVEKQRTGLSSKEIGITLIEADLFLCFLSYKKMNATFLCVLVTFSCLVWSVILAC